MGGWTPLSPYKIVQGSGQSLSLTASTAAPFAHTIQGPESRALSISLAPATTAYGATVRITGSGQAAVAAADFYVKSTDPPMILGCSPGDTVSVYPSAAGTAYLCELTH